MQFPSGLFIGGFDTFILVFVRMTGLFVVAPIFGRGNVPTYFKIGFSLLTSLILVNTLTTAVPPDYGNLLGYALLVIKEFVVGLTIGFVAYLAFTAIYVAGEIIDMQIGFGIVNVLDPVNNIQVPITSNLYFIVSMLVFLAVNGHHVLIKALFDSYKTVPIGGAVFDPQFENSLISIFGNVFFIGFKIAAPVVAAVLITNITLGTISRMVPQLNIFVIGMPLAILIGLIVMMITIPMFIYVLESVFKLMDGSVQEFIRGLAPK